MKIVTTIKLLTSTIVITTLLVVSTNAKAAESSVPVGFVAGIQGKGYILRGDSTILITGMDLIYPSDKITLPMGSKAKINICRIGGYEIRGETVCVIRVSKLIVVKGKQAKLYKIDNKTCALTLDVFRKNGREISEVNVNTKKGTLVLRTKKKERKGVYQIRGGREEPFSIKILNDKILASRPLLIWSKAAGSKVYKVNVLEDKGILWSVDTVKNYCSYPNTAPLLGSDSNYRVEIEALSQDGQIIAKGEAEFTLYSKDDEVSFQKDEAEIKGLVQANTPEMYILLGKFYEAYGLVPDAVSCYEKALTLDKENTGLHEHIALIKNEIE